MELDFYKNALQPESFIEKKYIRRTSGTLVDHKDYLASAFIPVCSNSVIKFKNPTGSNLNKTDSDEIGVTFFDSEQHVLAASTSYKFPGNTNVLVANTPEKACFMRYSRHKNIPKIECKYEDSDLYLSFIYNKILNMQAKIDAINEDIDELKDYNNNNKDYFDFSLFNTVGVLGDSYASGSFGEDSSATHDTQHLSLS